LKIALIGGTHGNEPVGIEVMSLFRLSGEKTKNKYHCFWGNPKAFEEKKRYIDCDLNRAFGKNGTRVGHEGQRAEELEKEIQGKFDFSIDLHTTTSNMGLTAILNNSHPLTQRAATYLTQEIPGLRLIEEDKSDEECTNLNRLCPAGITIEVGPVANNVVNAELVFKMYSIVKLLLNFDFNTEIKTTDVEYYKMLGSISFPEKKGWYVHPQIEGHDFMEMEKGFPWFVNFQGEVLAMEENGPLYPFFVNEAAYLENKTAFLIAEKKTGFSEKKSTELED